MLCDPFSSYGEDDRITSTCDKTSHNGRLWTPFPFLFPFPLDIYFTFDVSYRIVSYRVLYPSNAYLSPYENTIQVTPTLRNKVYTNAKASRRGEHKRDQAVNRYSKFYSSLRCGFRKVYFLSCVRLLDSQLTFLHCRIVVSHFTKIKSVFRIP